MKKALTFMLVLAMIVAMVGCGGSEAAKTDAPAANQAAEIGQAAEAQAEAAAVEVKTDDALKIGVSMRETKNPFYKAMSDTVASNCADKGIECIALDANGDIAQQIADIESLISMEVDCIIYDLNADPDAFNDVLQVARDAGIKLITYNDTVGPNTPVDASVLTATVDSCFAVGQWAGEKMGTTPIKALVMSGDIGNEVGMQRRTNVIRGIQEWQLAQYGKTNFEVVYQFYFDGWNSEIAAQKFEEVAPTLDFNMIITESDVATMYCWDSIVRYELEDVLIVCGADGSKECVKMVMDGDIDVTTMNSPTALGHMAFTTAVKMLNGEIVPEYIYTDVTCVTQENAAEFYNPDALF